MLYQLSGHDLIVAGARHYSVLQNYPISSGPTKPWVLWAPRGFAQGYSGKVMKLISHLYLLPRLRISTAAPPFIVCTGQNLPLYQKSSVFNGICRWKFVKQLFPMSIWYTSTWNFPCAFILTYCVTAFQRLLVWYWILQSFFHLYYTYFTEVLKMTPNDRRCHFTGFYSYDWWAG